jgi:molybdopterin synthase catalytic subunit
LTVRVRLFAIQRELAGTREVRVTLPAGSTVEEAWGSVVGTFPLLAPGRPYVRFALNGDYAEPSAPLRDGDEVVFLPPVSGGEDAIPPFRRLELTERPIDDTTLAELRAAVAHPRVGGIVTFTGVTRETPGTPAPGEEPEAARHAGSPVLGLTYEAFERLARQVLEEIADEIGRLHGVRRLAIVHRLGEVPVGETSVAVVAAAAHRGQAFEASRYAIDELKARAPIWKSERFADGSVWIGQPARSGPEPG